MKPIRVGYAFGMLALAWTGAASAQITDQQIQAGLELLPMAARAGAEVLVASDDGFLVRRGGDNGWSCRISLANDRLAANCHHRVLAGKLDLERRLAADGLKGAQIREHLAEQLRTGHLSIPPASVEISGSGPVPGYGQAPETMQGYYFVYFPFATSLTVGVPDRDPGDGGPWLHHGGTADAHIMWTRSHTPGVGG